MLGKSRAADPAPAPVVGDGQISKIADEVDRFFRSVHAEIEDWKFSMEDFGDGARIFVRFQIHINAGAISPGRPSASPPLPIPPPAAEGRGVATVERRPVGGPRAPATPVRGGPTVEALGADPELASFVEVFGRKRESRVHGEYHKKGAPYLEGSAAETPDTPTGDTRAP